MLMIVFHNPLFVWQAPVLGKQNTISNIFGLIAIENPYINSLPSLIALYSFILITQWNNRVLQFTDPFNLMQGLLMS